MAITAADILTAETMIASSWPLLSVALSGRWVLGMANGLSGRANALFFLDPNDDANVNARLDWMEATFAHAGLPARVRLSPLAPVAVIEQLKLRGYVFQNPTSVCVRVLDAVIAAPQNFEVVVKSALCESWLEHFVRCSGRFTTKAERGTLHMMLSSILDETSYVTLLVKGEPLATAMGIQRLGVMTVQNVAVFNAARGQGLGLGVMNAILAQGQKQDAKWCFVAVEQSNKRARALYRQLNFTDFYSYIYAVREN